MCGVLRRCEQAFLLNTKFLILAIGNQRVRDIPESAFDRLLVGQSHLFALCLGKTDVGLEPAALEYWLSKRTGQTPYAGRARKEIRERWTLVAGSPGE